MKKINQTLIEIVPSKLDVKILTGPCSKNFNQTLLSKFQPTSLPLPENRSPINRTLVSNFQSGSGF